MPQSQLQRENVNSTIQRMRFSLQYFLIFIWIIGKCLSLPKTPREHQNSERNVSLMPASYMSSPTKEPEDFYQDSKAMHVKPGLFTAYQVSHVCHHQLVIQHSKTMIKVYICRHRFHTLFRPKLSQSVTTDLHYDYLSTQ